MMRRRTLLCGVVGMLLCGGVLLLYSYGGNKRATSVYMSARNQRMMDDQCWVYMHLNKSGGSTIKHILSRWSEKYTTYSSEPWKKGADFAAEQAKQLLGEELDFIAGGYAEGLRPFVNNRCKWFTIFRHPVPRLVSAYVYCHDHIDQLCHTSEVNSSRVDLVTFAKHWGNFGVRQLALSLVNVTEVMDDAVATESQASMPGWYILKEYLERGGSALEVADGGVGERLPDRALYDMLTPARELLRLNYTAVGILEKFDETLDLFDRALGIPGLHWHKLYAKQGQSNRDRHFATLKKKALAEAWVSAEVKQYIGLDLLLYEHAVDIFNEQKRIYGV